jgi:hypothetical protein
MSPATTEPGAVPRAAWAIVAASVPAHLGLALATDLSPDEAYYLCAARRGGGLIDHPPLVVWLLQGSDRWTWAPVEVRVRLWAIAFALATGLACVELARRRGAGPEGLILAAWLGSWAILPTAGGFVLTPDGPLLLAVPIALILTGRGRLGAAGAALLGAGLGKVTALPIAAAMAATSRRTPLPARAWLALAPLLGLPWLWPSLRFQLHHAFGQAAPGGWSLLAAVGAVAGAAAAQVLLWSPRVIWRGLRGLEGLPAPDRAVATSLTGLVLVSALVRGVPPEPNWWAPAAIVVLVAFARSAGELSRGARRGVVAAIILPTLLAGAHTARPFLPLPERLDPTARLHGWSRGQDPVEAPGVGPYGPAAERCAYRHDCDEMFRYFNEMSAHE